MSPDRFDVETPHCQVGDTGIVLIVVIVDHYDEPINISTATSMKIKLQLPDGTTVDKTATFVTNGSDGQIQYVTQTGDLAEQGLYLVQGEVVLPGVEVSSKRGKLWVDVNVDNT